MAPPIRDKVFISYSHKDREIVRAPANHDEAVRPLGGSPSLDDTMIHTGADWHAHIQTALSTAKVGVMLVSSNFLASDFIAKVELPALLAARPKKASRSAGFWSAPASTSVRAHRFQAAHDISRPLDSLRPAELNETLTSIAREINRLANPPPPALPAKVNANWSARPSTSLRTTLELVFPEEVQFRCLRSPTGITKRCEP